MTNAGADITVKIYVGKDTYISMSSKTYYSYKNTINILDEDGNITPSRFVPLNDSECLLLVPDKLVPKIETSEVKTIKGIKVPKRRSKKQ